MIPQPPRATLTCTLFPDTSLFRSAGGLFPHDRHRAALVLAAAGLDRPAGGLGSGPMNCVVVTEAGKMAGQGASAGHSSAMDQSSNAVPALSRPALRVSPRSEEHTSELQSLMRNSYAVFCSKKTTKTKIQNKNNAEH